LFTKGKGIMKNRRTNYWPIQATAIPIAVVALTGCGSQGLDPRMYSVKLTDAKIPVMLSDTRVRDPGKEIHARGLKSKEYLSAGNYTRMTDKWSVSSPSEQVTDQMAGPYRFVQIRSIAFDADDYHMFSIAREVRVLRIDAEAVP
jgi:hypothetical protein